MRQGHENQEEEKKKTCLVHSLTLCMRIFVSQWVGTWWHILTVAKNRSLWKHYASHSCGNTRKSKPWRKCKLSAREVHLYRYVQSHSCQKQEMIIEDWNMQWPWNVLEEQQRDYSLYSSYGCALDFVNPPTCESSWQQATVMIINALMGEKWSESICPHSQSFFEKRAGNKEHKW